MVRAAYHHGIAGMAVILLAFALLALPFINAQSGVPVILFEDEEFYSDLTTFRWCFSPGWEDETLHKEFMDVYADNLGCDITRMNVYAVTPVTVKDADCSTEWDCVTDETYDEKNDTYHYEEVCSPVTACEDKVVWEKYDLEKTDYLFPKGSRVCYEAERSPKLGFQACDMNFASRVGGVNFDVKDEGKQWWNASFDYRIPINCGNMSDGVPIVVNNSGGFGFGGVNHQIVWTYCSGTGTSLYLHNLSDFSDYQVANETQRLPMDVENGSAPSYNSADVWDYGTDNYLAVYHMKDYNSSHMNDSTQYRSLVAKSNFNAPAQQGPGNCTIGNCEYYATNHYTEIDNNLLGGNGNFTIEYWIDADNTNGNHWPIASDWSAPHPLYIIYPATAKIRFDQGTADTSVNDVAEANTWVFMQLSHNTTGWLIYKNGALVEYLAEPEGAVDNAPALMYRIGCRGPVGSLACGTGELYDEWRVFNKTTHTATRGNQTYQNVIGSVSGYGDLGTTVLRTLPATLKAGLFDEDYVLIPGNVTDEGEDFWIFGNYTYDDNDTAINASFGFCNYTADEIVDEFYDRNVGFNTTVCSSGCNFSNRTSEFLTLPTGGFIYDILRFEVCHTGTVRRGFTVSTSCGALYSFGLADAPLCSGGSAVIDIIDANCSGAAGVNVSIWSAGANLGQSLTLVDDLVGVDRFHNESSDMVFNSTLQVWVTDVLHEYYVHGSNLINVSCFENVTGEVDNASVVLNVTVVNVPPVVTIDTIWWWLIVNPVLFSDGVVAKYPLSSTLNVSAVVIDDDLSNVTYYLNFSNGSNIWTGVESDSSSGVNFTQNNFSVNGSYLDGVTGYVFQVVGEDDSNNRTSLQRSFTAENDLPVGGWDNVSGQSFGVVPLNFSFTCSDSEGETPGYYLFLNGTLNQSGSGTSGWWLFNFSQGLWELDLVCEDSLRNGTNASISFTYIQGCAISIELLCDGCRYRDDELEFLINCTNGVVPDSCFYRINDFENVSISNCSAVQNFSAELGWNRFLLCTDNGGVLTERTINFWAKDNDASIWDFPVIFFMSLISLMFCLVWALTGYRLFGFMFGFSIALIGYELLSISMFTGSFAVVGGLLFGLYVLVFGRNRGDRV